jgi:aminopeptidase N
MNPPFHIPFAVKIGRHEAVLSLKSAEETFTFAGFKERPVPSLLRNFSAPVILNYPYTEADLIHLMAHDDDAFNRWEAGQRLAASTILEAKGAPTAAFMAAARELLRERDPAFAAEALSLPAETFLAEQLEVVDPDALHESRNRLRRELGRQLEADLLSVYKAMKSEGAYSPDPGSIGRRALRNLCLSYLVEVGHSALAYEQFRAASNMTDAMAALTALANVDCPSVCRRWIRSMPGGSASRWSSTSGSRCRPPRACRGRWRVSTSCCRIRRSTSRCPTRCTRSSAPSRRTMCASMPPTARATRSWPTR